MKYTVIIQQPKLLEFGINVNQGAILYLLCIAPLWADTEVIDDEVYYWVSRQTIAKELKAFQLKPDTIYRHLKKLQEKELIGYIKVGKKDCIKLTKKGKGYLDKTPDNYYVGNKSEKDINSEINPTKLGNKSEKNSEINPTYQYTNIINTQNNQNKKINKKSFSFSLSKKAQFENLSKEYKHKLKAKLLLEFGTKALDKLNDFELSCVSNGYQYKNFYAAFRKWYKDLSPRLETNIDANIKNMPKDFIFIGTANNIAYAVNPKTLEIKEGKAIQKQTAIYQKEQNSSYGVDEVGQSGKMPLNRDMSNLLGKVAQKF